MIYIHAFSGAPYIILISKIKTETYRPTLCLVVIAMPFITDQLSYYGLFETLRPRQDGRHFPDDIFIWIFLNEIISI